ncbi:MAG: MBL fold metallo-hydrolase [Acidimicrobiia bacterium]
MIFRQYQLGCLSLFSYLIGDETTGRAVVVDPQRDVSEYLADSTTHGLRIERIIETHFHADFLSGHLELAAATGAPISFGDAAHPDYPIEPLAHGQRIELGDVMLEVRNTPGHTPESISLVVHEHADAGPWGVLTGDALFIGDVGRPDLLASAGWTGDQLARLLYHSLQDQLLSLPDPTRVFPAHGAGSSCGKHLSVATESTIGEQRTTNYALAPMSEDAFVNAVTEGQTAAPAYFAFAADANHRERELLDEHEPPEMLDLDAVQSLQHDGATVIDTRTPETFAAGHLRGAINVGLDGRFAEYAGSVIDPHTPIVVITDTGRETEAKVRLARIGFDNVAGALAQIETVLLEHPECADRASRVSATAVDEWRRAEPGLLIVDIRNPGEHEAGAIAGSTPIPLGQLRARRDELDPRLPTVVYCAGGSRSSIAASTLRTLGVANVADILGGYEAWTRAGLPIEPTPTDHAPTDQRKEF